MKGDSGSPGKLPIAAVAVASLSWSLALGAYSLLVHSGWPVGSDLPEDLRTNLFLEASPAGPVGAYLLCLSLPAVVIVSWYRIEEWLLVDPERLVAGSVQWALSVLWRPVLALAAVVVAVLVSSSRNDVLLVVLLVAWVVAGVGASVRSRERGDLVPASRSADSVAVEVEAKMARCMASSHGVGRHGDHVPCAVVALRVD